MASTHASHGLIRTLFAASGAPFIVNEQDGSFRKVSRLVAAGLVLFACANTAHAQGPSLVADFNGDGIDDLAVGAPVAGGRGSVSIFLGVPGGFSTTAPTTPNLTRSGLLAGEEYGGALAAADFNGDGRSELVVGAPLWNGGRGRIDILRFLPSGGSLLIVGGPYSQQTLGTDPAEPDDWFGRALTTGDFDGNGYPDLAVGVPGEDVHGVFNAGAVQVLYSRSPGIRVEGNQFWSQRGGGILDEPQVNDQFGSALAAGDFNGDGIDDLAVGVPLEDFNLLNQGFVNQGAVNVIFGTPAGLSSKSDQFLTISDGGQFSKAQLGYALAAGDINGDGFADLAIGAPNGLDRVGFVAITYGAAGGLGALFVHFQTVDPPEEGDQLGYSLAVADFNGDGFADVAAGAPGEDLSGLIDVGAVTVFYGRRRFSLNRQEFWHQNTYGVEDKIETSDFFGQVLAAGDYNGDGLADLAIGVPWEDIGSIVNAGVTNIITGTSAGLTAGVDYLLVAATSARDAFFGLSLSR